MEQQIQDDGVGVIEVAEPIETPVALALIDALLRLESWSGWNQRRLGSESRKQGYWRKIENDFWCIAAFGN